MLRRHRCVEEEVLLSMTHWPASAANAAVLSARTMDGIVGERLCSELQSVGSRRANVTESVHRCVWCRAPFLHCAPATWPIDAVLSLTERRHRCR